MSDKKTIIKSQNIVSELEPILSICIPTFNRCQELSNSLTNTVAMLRVLPEHKIEIIVSDNGSTDDTKPSLLNFQYKNKDIQTVFVFNETNLGFDNNYLQTIKNANGKYVWVIGDDDIFDLDALNCILNECENNIDYIVFDGVGLDVNGKEKSFRLKDKFIVNNSQCEWVGDFCHFFKLYGWHATWISVSIMRRSLLMKEMNNINSLIGLHFIHVPLIASSFSSSLVKVINKIIVRDPPIFKSYTESYERIYTYFGHNLCKIVDQLILTKKIDADTGKQFLLGHSANLSMFGVKFFLMQRDKGATLKNVLQNFKIIKRISSFPYLVLLVLLLPKVFVVNFVSVAKKLRKIIDRMCRS
ncbi:MAG: glycosyltransferase family 2 protein [Plesiomonas sp.]